MYICNDCDNQFDEPRAVKEIHDEVPPPNEEIFYVCPNCGSSDYYEAVVCCYCNEDIRSDLKSLYVYFADNSEIVCNDCLHDYCVSNFS